MESRILSGALIHNVYDHPEMRLTDNIDLLFALNEMFNVCWKKEREQYEAYYKDPEPEDPDEPDFDAQIDNWNGWAGIAHSQDIDNWV